MINFCTKKKSHDDLSHKKSDDSPTKILSNKKIQVINELPLRRKLLPLKGLHRSCY
jgi:hypothetical protein